MAAKAISSIPPPMRGRKVIHARAMVTDEMANEMANAIRPVPVSAILPRKGTTSRTTESGRRIARNPKPMKANPTARNIHDRVRFDDASWAKRDSIEWVPGLRIESDPFLAW